MNLDLFLFCFCVKHSPSKYCCWQMKWSKLKSLTDKNIFKWGLHKKWLQWPKWQLRASKNWYPLIQNQSHAENSLHLFPHQPKAYQKIIMGRIYCTIHIQRCEPKVISNMYKWLPLFPLVLHIIAAVNHQLYITWTIYSPFNGMYQ